MVKVQQVSMRAQDQCACHAFAVMAFVQECVGQSARCMGRCNSLMQIQELRRYIRLS